MNALTSLSRMNLYKNIKIQFAQFTKQVSRITPNTSIIKVNTICPVCGTTALNKLDFEFYLKGERMHKPSLTNCSMKSTVLKQSTYLNTEHIWLSDNSQKKYIDMIQDRDRDQDDIRKLIC